MPKIYINCPKGTFSQQKKKELANDLTNISLTLEKLPATPYVRSTVWIYFNEYPKANVFHGGEPGGTNVIGLEVNIIKGGLDDAAKELLIEQFTTSIALHAEIKNDPLPIYFVLRNVEAADWGIFGKTIKLADLYNPHQDKEPI